MTSIAGTYEYVYIDAAGQTSDYQTVNAQISLAGKMVICNRGTISFYQKADYCASFNPKAVVIANNQDGSISMDLSSMTSTFPCVSILLKDALALKEESTKTTVGGIDVYTGTVTVETGLSYGLNETIDNAIISDFSSTGVAGSLVLKPEITAPGGSIWSVNGMTDDGYELMSGTSMAAPHVTGMAAVVGEYLEEIGLAGEKRHNANSLLMSTAVPMKHNGNYYSLLQQGAGLGNVGAAVSSKSLIKMDANATVSYNDGKVKVELGDDPSRTGRYIYSFYITNYSDVDLVYNFATDMFTQEVSVIDGNRMVSLDTTNLPASVSYAYDAPTAFSADVNKDGFTDAEDAQAILDYLTGKVAGSDLNLAVADIDSNDKVTSYDARLLLNKLNEDLDVNGLLVRAGETKKVDVKIQLNNVEQLSALYDKGNFVEGFTFVKCQSVSGEGEILDVEKSIPILGYFGSWTDASMYDSASKIDAAYSENPKVSYIGADSNYMNITYPNETSSTIYYGNPYMGEEEFPVDRLAISNAATVGTIGYANIRKIASGGPAAVKLDSNGDPVSVLWTGSLSSGVENPYYNANSSSPAWQSRTTRTATINKTVSSFGLQEGDKIWIGQFSLPEYYGYKLSGGTSYSLTSDQFKSVLLSGDVGEGAVMGYKFTIDDTAPVIESAELSVDKKSLEVVVRDNQYIAYLALLDGGGSTVIKELVPEQSAANQEVRYTFDISSLNFDQLSEDEGAAVTIMACDYAGNENVQLAIVSPGTIVIHHKYYVLTSTVEAGKKYIICNSNSASSSNRNAMNANGTGVNNSTVKVVTDTELSDSSHPVIYADSLSSQNVVWEAVASGNSSYPVKFKSASGTYLNYTSSTRSSSSIKLVDEASSNVNACYWSYPSGNRVRNAGNTSVYLYYYNSGGGRWVTYTSNTACYLYEEKTYDEVIDPSVAKSVTINPSTSALYNAGSTVQLTATVLPVYLTDKSVVWSSSDESIATVDQNGLVTSQQNGGNVTITATSVTTPSVSGSATINVVAANKYDGYVYGVFNTGDGAYIGALDFSSTSFVPIFEASAGAKGGGVSGANLWVLG